MMDLQKIFFDNESRCNSRLNHEVIETNESVIDKYISCNKMTLRLIHMCLQLYIFTPYLFNPYSRRYICLFYFSHLYYYYSCPMRTGQLIEYLDTLYT